MHGAPHQALPGIVGRVSSMFDVAADPAVISGHLSSDPLLTYACAAHDGIRVPGAWDPFELSVRAILGQQITVRTATTMAGRVAARLGNTGRAGRAAPPLSDRRSTGRGTAGRSRIIRARANAIRSLAKAVCDGELTFDDDSTHAALRRIPALANGQRSTSRCVPCASADAFPSGDIVLRRMAANCSAGELDARAERWRPYRSYAVMLLWQSAVDSRQLRVSVPSSQPSSESAGGLPTDD